MMMVNAENRHVIGDPIDEIVDKYTFLVREIDGQTQVTVVEWEIEVTEEDGREAMEVAQQQVEERLDEVDEEDWPEPLSTRDYSGRFNVRIPKSLHRELAEEADELGVSLNDLIKHKLSR